MSRPVTKAPAVPGSTASTRLRLDPIKDRRLRQWACKLASDLPSDGADALAVLRYAEQLLKSWIARGDVAESKQGRAAR